MSNSGANYYDARAPVDTALLALVCNIQHKMCSFKNANYVVPIYSLGYYFFSNDSETIYIKLIYYTICKHIKPRYTALGDKNRTNTH